MRNEDVLEMIREARKGTESAIRTYHILKREGIDTIEQLIRKTQNEVIKIRGMGARSYNEIVEALERRGLQLRRY